MPLVFEQRISNNLVSMYWNCNRMILEFFYFNQENKLQNKIYFKLDLYATVGVDTKSRKWCSLQKKTSCLNSVPKHIISIA